MIAPHFITASATIHAPIERVFALSTRVELVGETLGMAPVADKGYVTQGHVTANSRVHWYGWKFGLPTHHHTLITGFTAPHVEPDGTTAAWFQDSQASGRFAFFRHDHRFCQTLDFATQEPLTTLSDEVRFTLPLGPLGHMAATLLVAPHVRKLCHERFSRIKALAESDAWREFIDPAVL